MANVILVDGHNMTKQRRRARRLSSLPQSDTMVFSDITLDGQETRLRSLRTMCLALGDRDYSGSLENEDGRPMY